MGVMVENQSESDSAHRRQQLKLRAVIPTQGDRSFICLPKYVLSHLDDASSVEEMFPVVSCLPLNRITRDHDMMRKYVDPFALLEIQYHHHHGTAQGIMSTTSLLCHDFNYNYNHC